MKTLITFLLLLIGSLNGLSQDRNNNQTNEITEIDFATFCSLSHFEGVDNALEYIGKKGFKLKDVYNKLGCPNIGTSIVNYLILNADVYNFIRFRMEIIEQLGEEAYLEFINLKSPFTSVDNMCPLTGVNFLLEHNPSNNRLQKIKSLLVEYGAVEDCENLKRN